MDTLQGYDAWKLKGGEDEVEIAIRDAVIHLDEHELVEECLRSGIDVSSILDDLRDQLVDRRKYERAES